MNAQLVKSTKLRKPLRKLSVIVLGMAALLMACLLALPTVLGTRWIYRPLIERLAADDFLVDIDSVQLRWFSPLKLERIEVKQLDGIGLLSIAEIRCERSLFGYLIGGRRIGRIEIVRPTVDVKLLADSSSLERFIKAIEGKTQSSTDVSRGGKLRVDVEVAILGASAKVHRENEPAPLVVIPPFDLSVQYLAAAGPSKLRIAPTQILNEVELTPELVDLGLAYAVPLLAQSAWFDGKISLEIAAIEIPLDEPVQSTGEAVLTLHTVRSGPAQPAIVGLLDFIAKMRGRAGQHELVFVDDSKIAIGLQDAQVTHSGLQVGLPKLDSRLQLETSGSVGLIDKRLAMILKVPVPVEQLARRDQVKELGVPKLNVPIGGTLDNPTVDWGLMRGESAELLGLIRSKIVEDAPGTASVLSALEGLAGGEADQAISAASDMIKALRDRRRTAKEAAESQQKANEPGEIQATESRPRILDALRNRLRGTSDSP